MQCNGHLKWSIIIIINVKVEHNSSNINNVERLIYIIRYIYHDFSKTPRTPESSHRSGFLAAKAAL